MPLLILHSEKSGLVSLQSRLSFSGQPYQKQTKMVLSITIERFKSRTEVISTSSISSVLKSINDY